MGCADHTVESRFDFFDRGQNVIYLSAAFSLFICATTVCAQIGRSLIPTDFTQKTRRSTLFQVAILSSAVDLYGWYFYGLSIKNDPNSLNFQSLSNTHTVWQMRFDMETIGGSLFNLCHLLLFRFDAFSSTNQRTMATSQSRLSAIRPSQPSA